MVEHFHLVDITLDETHEARNYKLTYDVFTDDKADGPLTIHESSKMPFRGGDVYRLGNDYDPYAFLISISTNQVPKNSTAWKAVFDFSTDVNSEISNPLNEPPEIELVFAQKEKLLEQDVNGKAIRNTVGDRFDDVITREDSQPILRISRNEPSSLGLFGMDLRDTVNRSPWMGAPRRTIKFQPPTLRSRWHRVIGTYYAKNYEFKFSDETWRFVLLNQGYYEKDADSSDNTKRKRITVKGEPIQQPVALTEEGLVLPEGDDPVWLEFDGYRESMFPPSLAVSL